MVLRGVGTVDGLTEGPVVAGEPKVEPLRVVVADMVVGVDLETGLEHTVDRQETVVHDVSEVGRRDTVTRPVHDPLVSTGPYVICVLPTGAPVVLAVTDPVEVDVEVGGREDRRPVPGPPLQPDRPLVESLEDVVDEVDTPEDVREPQRVVGYTGLDGPTGLGVGLRWE